LHDATEADYALTGLIKPAGLKGFGSAVRLIENAMSRGQSILIVGDYDADGATSVALLVSGLRALGANNVSYMVPDRFRLGYGLSPEIVDLAKANKPELLITVDSGISSVAGVERARALGIKVIITDHHLPGETLPDADAIVNPNQPECQFQSKNLAGVGVAFYLLSGVRARLREQNIEKAHQLNLARYLDLVALGTIADLVPLDRNNRILVDNGIRGIRAGRGNLGIKALLAIAGVDEEVVTTRDLAFALGPRLNAAGRIENMSIGIECLLASVDTAREFAEQLDELNLERRSIESSMRRQADDLLKSKDFLKTDSTGLCLYDQSWHEGVVGILASRIKDLLNRPVFVFAPAMDGSLKGSGRSIKGFHLTDALAMIASEKPGLVSKFGGHAMAAGLSLEHDHLEEFSARFEQITRSQLGEELREKVCYSDGAVSEFGLATVTKIVRDQPWGQGFEEPVFDDIFEIVSQRLLSGQHLKLQLRLKHSPLILEGIFFNRDQLIEDHESHFAYKLDVNRFRGVDRVQLVIQYQF
jgi:single-stranded-DNA-specific exonuclease